MKRSLVNPSAAQMFAMNTKNLPYSLVVVLLRVGLVALIVAAGWIVTKTLPTFSADTSDAPETTTVQIILRRDHKDSAATDGLPVRLYPIDIVAVHHEFFAERRAGERYDDFMKQRMKGRAPMSVSLDPQGQATVALPRGNWWIHVTAPGEEEIEWRLPVKVSGRQLLVELTPQNAYLRTKSF